MTRWIGRAKEQFDKDLAAYEEAVRKLESTSTSTPVPVGGLWENQGWKLETNLVVSKWEIGPGAPCPHCKPFADEPRWNYPSGRSWDEARWVAPRVIVAFNEGGCATTGVCLDCVLDFAKGEGLS